MGLLADIFAAHGGLDRWRRVRAVQAHVAAGGLAFASRGQPSALRDFRATVEPAARRVELDGFGRPGWHGVWTPAHLQLHDERGALLGEREQPRAQFDRWVKKIAWDKLDIFYFSGFAFWNYLSFPFLLTSSEVAVAEEGNAAGRRLRVVYGAGFPTFSREQTFHFDPALRLTRHDYVVDPIARWAAVAHLCLASAKAGGFVLHTRRRVFPRLGAYRMLPAPELVHIRFDDLHAIDSVAAASTETTS